MESKEDAEMMKLRDKAVAISKLAAEVLTVRRANCCIEYSELFRQTPFQVHIC